MRSRPAIPTERRAGAVAALVEALPLPAALLAGEGLRITAVNDGLMRLMAGKPGAAALFAPEHPIGRAEAALLRADSGEGCVSFRWHHGNEVSGQLFLVTITRVDAALSEPACLVTLLDRTAEIASARSLRAELAHDSLTGLPNRAAFAEAVEERAAAGSRHAVLLVDLAASAASTKAWG